MGFENVNPLSTEERRSEKHPLDVLSSLSLERREDILEIVDFCGHCVDIYVKEFDVYPIPRENFFFYTDNTTNKIGMYDPRRHMFGIHQDALYMPHILIHEMIHFVAAEKLTTPETGYWYQNKQGGENEPKMFYEAINEGMTDLMAQEIYSLNYLKLKTFFAGRGGMERFVGQYSEEIIFIQKLIEYKATTLSIQEKIPQEEAHIQVWSRMKQGYFSNNHTYLEDLFNLFIDTKEQREEMRKTMRELRLSRDHKKKTALLIEILDRKITALRAQI